jgi:protein-S-isoprenylcysteine O-methyltransferase Ste14
MSNDRDPQPLQPTPGDDRPNRIPWPPIIQASMLVSAWLLERFVPLPFILPQGAFANTGWSLVVLGIATAVSGILAFKSIGTAVDPTGRATGLATGGIYRFTRNPMYLGSTIAFIGLAFALGSSWLLAFGLILPVALRKLAIEREEAYLNRRFGEAYANYCRRVRRWI